MSTLLSPCQATRDTSDGQHCNASHANLILNSLWTCYLASSTKEGVNSWLQPPTLNTIEVLRTIEHISPPFDVLENHFILQTSQTVCPDYTYTIVITNSYRRSWYLEMALPEEHPAPAFVHLLSHCTSLDHNNSTAFPWVPFFGIPAHFFSSFEYEASCQVLGCHRHLWCFLPHLSLTPSSPILCYAMEGCVHCMCLDPLHQCRPSSGPQLPAFQ